MLKQKLSAAAFSVREQLDDFVYDDPDFETTLDIEQYSNEKFNGQCRTGTKIREGRGTRISQDGSVYEGYWANGER